MKRIYYADTDIHASLLQEILEDRGIKAVVQEARLLSLRGELPLVHPSVWVADEDAEQAREIAAEFDRGGPGRERKNGEEDGTPDDAQDAERGPESEESEKEEEGSWTCPLCGERNGSRFAECWKCSGETARELAGAESGGTSSAQRRLRVIAAVLVATALLIASFFIISSSREGGYERPIEPPIRIR